MDHPYIIRAETEPAQPPTSESEFRRRLCNTAGKLLCVLRSLWKLKLCQSEKRRGRTSRIDGTINQAHEEFNAIRACVEPGRAFSMVAYRPVGVRQRKVCFAGDLAEESVMVTRQRAPVEGSPREIRMSLFSPKTPVSEIGWLRCSRQVRLNHESVPPFRGC